MPRRICQSHQHTSCSQADHSSADSAYIKTRGWFGRPRLNHAYRSEKAITLSCECLDKSGIIRRISQNIAHLLDRVIQALVKGDINIARPNFLA